jgi:hypothetical protein
MWWCIPVILALRRLKQGFKSWGQSKLHNKTLSQRERHRERERQKERENPNHKAALVYVEVSPNI